MNMNAFKKLARYNRRLDQLSFLQKSQYIAKVLFGEHFRRRGISPLFGPRLIEFALTHRCQCRCVHCYSETDIPISTADELTTMEVFSILDQAAAMFINEVCFSGGEPLLRKDLVELIRYARKMRLVPKINTNGILLSRKMVGSLKSAGLGWCSVSIDNHRPEIHDRLRCYEGCYEKAVKGLVELVRQGIPASITTYARKDGISTGELQKIIDLGHALKVETVRILFPVPMGGFKGRFSEVLSKEERELVRRYLLDPIVTMESPHEKTRCTAAVTKMNILPDGVVTPCVFIPSSYGNLRHEPLKEIWKRMAEFDRIKKPNGRCPMSDPKFCARAFPEIFGAELRKAENDG